MAPLGMGTKYNIGLILFTYGAYCLFSKAYNQPVPTPSVLMHKYGSEEAAKWVDQKQLEVIKQINDLLRKK